MIKKLHPSLYIDWFVFSLICILSSLGLLFVFSATYNSITPFSLFFKKQAIGVIGGIILYWIFTFLDYRSLMRWGYFSYFAFLALLLFTLIKGTIGMGAQRWINLFFFRFQPSELAKLLFPAFVAYYFFTHNEDKKYTQFQLFLPLFIMIGISFLLIAKQPDLGTALIIAFSGLTLFWSAGLSRRFFLAGILVAILGAPILWKMLKPYQRNRITVFLGSGTTQKERYQIEQAAIAIGSGGVWGKGILKGTQNQLQFLPESRTDFIFAVVCEEWGFIGAIALLLLYALLFIRLLILIRAIEPPYLQLLALGLLLHLILSAIINICMVTGLLPIVGIPLPFMSYGLTNLLISFVSLGWIQGIYLQQ